MSTVIQLFSNEIKNQLSTTIHILYTVNALEYVKNDVFTFYSKNDIIHQTFFSHTS